MKFIPAIEATIVQKNRWEGKKMLNIITIKPRPRNYLAVQFNGKNGKDIVAWILEQPKNDDAVARGSYIDVGYSEGWLKVRKTAWVVVDPEGEIDVYSDAEFNSVYILKK